MDIKIRGKTDKALASVKKALLCYQGQHPESEIEIYRLNSISIRIRVVDPGFAGMRKSDRHALVWEYLEKLSERIQSDISMVVLLSPEEVAGSLANLEFEEPTPSLIR